MGLGAGVAKRRNITVAILLGVMLWVLPVSQAEEFTPEPVELENELTQAVVTALTQDQQGFIWIGTQAGLNRYDGYQVEQYFSANSALSFDEINVLTTDSAGNVWIGTEHGLNVFLQDKGELLNFLHNPGDPFSIVDDRIFSLLSGKDGNVWIGTSNGIFLYQAATQSFKKFPLLNSFDIKESMQEISSLSQIKETIILGTTTGKIAILNNKKGQFEIVELSQSLGTINKILPLADNHLLIVADKRLYRLQWSTKQVEPLALSNFGISASDIKISEVLVVEPQLILIGTEENGLYFIDLEKNTSDYYGYKGSKLERIGANHVNSLLQDADNLLWVGTDANLHRININSLKFSHYYKKSEQENSLTGDSIFSLTIDSDGWLWAGSELNGLSVLKPQGRDFIVDPNIKFADNGYSINSIVEGSIGYLWIMTADSLWSYDKAKNSFQKYSELDFDNASLFSAHYRQGKLWITSSKGLWLLEDGNIKQHILVDQQSFSPKNHVYDLLFEKDSIWLATEQGLIKYDTNNGQFTEIGKLIENAPIALMTPIFDLDKDLHGRLWVATYGNGLLRLDFTTQKIMEINNKNSSLNNVVYSIQQDKHYNLWLATAGGLFRLDPTNFSLAHFSLEQGQPIHDFNLGSKIIDRKGRIFLGGINGIIGFDPKKYVKDESLARPVITKILVNNKLAKIGADEDAHVSVPVNISPEISLHHQDTSLILEFSNLQYTNPEDNRFRYKLEGYDKEWYEVGAHHRRAVYPKLKSGSYVFRLMAANKDGIWNPQSVDLSVKVRPSPFLSTWALGFYIAISSSLLLIAFSMFQSRNKERRAAQTKLEESEERLKLSLWGSGDELWDWDIGSGALHLSNEWDIDFPRDGIRSGYSDAHSNIHPNDLAYVKQALSSHIRGKSQHFESTYRLQNDADGWIWVLDQGKVVEFDGETPIRMAGTLKNITEIKDAEQRLSVIAKSFENISDAVWILDANLNYVVINKAFETITGYSEEDVIGSTMDENAIDGMNQDFYKKLRAILDKKGTWHGELEAIRSNGSVYPIEININVVRDNDGNIINYVGVFSDITYRKRAEKELRRLATTDQLTNLPNRNTFHSEVEMILSHSDSSQRHALLFIDLDNFKRINDSLGHGVGDELLIRVAEILGKIVNTEKDMVARFGGDEFIVFLQNIEAWNLAAGTAQQILDRFAHTLQLSANEVIVSPSIGIVMYPENGETAEELLRNADTAMYYAKKKGKNTFQFYTNQMNEQAKIRLSLENDLRQAIEKDEFLVFYQPKVSLETGDISGFEALVRWRNEERGLVSPNEFIPLAEESGLIIPISQQVIEKTCIQVKDWQKRGLFKGKIAINLSAIQFYHENLWQTVKNALHLSKLDASTIEFEITEGMVMQDLSHSIQQMNSLKEMGVSLALDDFGVGYSSLGNLKDFPIDTLKIDRSFVWDLDDSKRDRQLVASIVTLAHNLGVKVVAEGVETIEQLEALRAMKCEEIQGFIFSQPLPAFEVEKLLESSEATLEKALADWNEIE